MGGKNEKKILGLILIFVLGCTDKTDKNGFFIEGENINFNKETKSKYDKDGYDYKGFNKNGYNAKGYDKDGFNFQGYSKYGYDKDGFNKDGYDKDGFNKDGWSKDGVNKLTNDFYNKDGFNKGGFTRYGFNSKNKFEKKKFYKYKFEESKFIFINKNIYEETQKMLINGLRDIFYTNINLKNLKKDEFETTSEFKIRKKNLATKYSKEIEDIKNEYYLVYSTSDAYIKGKYDADSEEWNFNEIYKTSNNNSYFNRYYDYNFKNSPITINLKVKMPILEAKSKKSLKAIIRFLVTDTTLNTAYNYSFQASNFLEAKVVAYQIYTVFEDKEKLVKEVYID